jgi:tetratricopeptide (TPR) repeat protein
VSIRLPRPIRHFGRALARVGRPPARVLAHLLLLPVDVLFLAFDLFAVNLRKTRLFKNDCRGKDSYHGGRCPPSRKYTNRFLFRCVCREAARSPHGGFACRARERVRISYVRCLAAGVTLAALVLAADVATVHFWPRTAGGPDTAARVTRLVAERVQKGDAAYSAGNYADALPLFQGAVRLAPDNKELWYKAGLCLAAQGQSDDADSLGCADGTSYAILADQCLWQGDPTGAGRFLAAAQDAGSADKDALLVARAHMLLVQKKPEEAIGLLDGVPAGSAFAPLAALYRMDALWKTGQPQKGIEQLESVANAPSTPAWLSLVAVDSRFAAGQRKEALTEADKAAARFDKDAQVKLRLARILSARGEDGRAILLAQGCASEPQLEAQSSDLLAGIYLRRGLPELAKDCAGRALAADAGDVEAMLLAGRAALALGDAQGAATEFKAATRAAPDRVEAWQMLASAQSASRDAAGAEESLRQACKLDPKDAAAHEQLALVLLSAGRKADARKELETATSLAPGAYASWTSLGLLAQQDNDLPKARECYSRAVEAAPDRAVVAANNLAELLLSDQHDVPLALAFAYAAHLRSAGTPLHAQVADTLAQALIRAGYPATALGVAREAAGADPQSADRRFRLGVAEAAAGNNTAAISALEEAAHLEPDSEPGKMAQGLAEFLRKQAEQPAAPKEQAPAAGNGG